MTRGKEETTTRFWESYLFNWCVQSVKGWRGCTKLLLQSSMPRAKKQSMFTSLSIWLRSLISRFSRSVTWHTCALIPNKKTTHWIVWAEVPFFYFSVFSTLLLLLQSQVSKLSPFPFKIYFVVFFSLFKQQVVNSNQLTSTCLFLSFNSIFCLCVSFFLFSFCALLRQRTAIQWRH